MHYVWKVNRFWVKCVQWFLGICILQWKEYRAHVIHLPFVTIHRVLYSTRIIYETYFLSDECSILSKYFLVWKIYDCGWVGESTFYQKVESFILFLFCPPSSCFCPQTWPNVPKRVKIFFHLRFIVGAQARKYLDRSKGYTIRWTRPAAIPYIFNCRAVL